MFLKPASSPDAVTRLQATAAIAVALLSVGWLLWATLRSSDVPFLTGEPAWIMVDAPLDSNAVHVDLDQVPAVRFETSFDLAHVPAGAILSARALTDAQFLLNGRLLSVDNEGASWRESRRVEVGSELAAGRNDIEVRVSNAHGPPLLQLEILDDGGAALLETDARWNARAPAKGRAGLVHARAIVADDTRPHPQSLALPSTGVMLRRYAAVVGLIFVVSALLRVALARSLSERGAQNAPRFVLAVATLLWLAIYVFKTTGLPVLMGFDIVGHLQYIDFLLEHRKLPQATDGWSTYHPPLGHLVTALIASLPGLARESTPAQWLYRLPTFLACLGNVWAVYFVARRLFAEQPLRQCLAIGFAALLPMNLYMSAYVSNEPLHSFLVSLSLALAVSLLARRDTAPKHVAGLALALGLAIMTKFTALVAVPLVAGILGVKLWLVERASPGKSALVTVAVVTGAALVGGWVYARNWMLFGRPVVGNWDLPGNRVWWEHPGFHTLDYYTSFGQALRHPFFAGYSSFWDGLYSTLWGDGLVAGMIRVSTRHDAWNYDFMTLGYWLAFPATIALVVGFVRALRYCVRGPDKSLRLAMSLLLAFLYALSFALLSITLRLPYYAQAKASYVLSVIVPLSIVAALGLAWVPERLTGKRLLPLQMIYYGWLGTLAAVLALAFLG